jgi:hypothetical protein
MKYVSVPTRRCPICKKGGVVVVDHQLYREGNERYRNGELIQDAFHFLDKSIREQLMSGTHPDCWNDMFGNMDDDNNYDNCHRCENCGVTGGGVENGICESCFINGGKL